MMNIKSPFVLLALLCGLSYPLQAANIVINNLDDPNEGFNDPTPVAPVGDNPKTTLGEQRLYAFQKAAEHWAGKLNSPVTIVIEAKMDPQECDAKSGTLGATGTSYIFYNFQNAPLKDTWYHSALAGSLAGQKLNAELPDIRATFNSDMDNNDNCLQGVSWYYGVDGNVPKPNIDFFGVVLHEIAHGIGFSTFVDASTGQEQQDNSGVAYPDIFETFLEDHSLSQVWSDMTAEQRRTSALNTNNLHWIGKNVIAASSLLKAGTDGDHVRMYAPSEFEPGSSVSHWDTSLYPNELMEPDDTGDEQNIVTDYLLRDLGWDITIGETEPDVPPPNVYCNDTRIDIPDDRPNGLTSSIQINDTGTVSNIAVSLNVEHTFVDDLLVILESSAGTAVTLLDGRERTTECGASNIDAVLWDGASEAANTQCNPEPAAAIEGMVSPFEPLNILNGQSLNGEWRLKVSDLASLDTGSLVRWCLLPESQGVCDGSQVTLNQTSVLQGESLVCNAGVFNGSDIQVKTDGELKINYSSKVNFSSLKVENGGRLHIRYQAPPQ